MQIEKSHELLKPTKTWLDEELANNENRVAFDKYLLEINSISRALPTIIFAWADWWQHNWQEVYKAERPSIFEYIVSVAKIYQPLPHISHIMLEAVVKYQTSLAMDLKHATEDLQQLEASANDAKEIRRSKKRKLDSIGPWLVYLNNTSAASRMCLQEVKRLSKEV